MDALEHAVEMAGGQAKLARMLGLAPQVVNNWIRRANVPAEHCPAIERVLGGRVTCEQLRSDVDWAQVRGCKCEKAAA